MQQDDDIYMLKYAYNLAMNSPDPSTQNGAVIATPGTFPVAFGINKFPEKVATSPERWERPGKYQWVEHAERNAIYYAAQNGIATKGLTMYVPWFACTDCARAIIQAGIKEVVGHDYEGHRFASQSWLDSIEVAYQMFNESGVRYRWIDHKFGVNIRFNEKEVIV